MKSTSYFRVKIIAALSGCALTLCMFQGHAHDNTLNSLHPDAQKVIDVWLKAQLDYQQIPYLSIAYAKDQQLVLSSSYGHLELARINKVTNSTMASICSISKVFTATAIMKLVDQGKLSLSDRVADLLPELTIQTNGHELGDIKLIHLLNHTSGLPRDTTHSYWSGPEHNFPTKEMLYKSLVQQQRENAADTVSNYSNVGYALLGQIIEKTSKKSYKDYMESEIFAPLNMTSSVVEMSNNNYGKTHALGYSAINRNGTRHLANFYKTNAMQSAAGISSNAQDLAKFAMWQFREVSSPNTEIMSSDSLQKMYQTNHSRATQNRGLGYQIQNSKSGDIWAMHGGMCPGYNSFLQINTTQKEGFSVVTSANRVRAISYINNLKEILKQASQIDEAPNVHSHHKQVPFSDYEGFYDLNPWNSEYYVGRWGNQLVLLYLPVNSIKHAMHVYQNVGQDIFKLVKDGKLTNDTLIFNRDQAGKVVSVTNDGNQHSKL